MKIAILSRYQETINRGAETFVQDLAGQLSKTHEVEILVGNDSDSLPKMISGKYDVVIPMNGRIQGVKALLGKIKSGYKIISIGESGIGRDLIWNLLAGKPDVFVALTSEMAVWAKKWAWGSRVVKIPNGVDTQIFNPVGERWNFDLPGPIILSVGALVWSKYHERTIAAVAGLKNGSLVIVGKGPLEEDLQKMGNAKLPGRFAILSAKHDQMPQIYRAADIFTLPSWNREAFGIVYIEAMASGLPVVAPDDASRAEIVGDAGVLVDVADTKKFSAGLEQALGVNWGDKPRIQGEKFSWKIVGQKYNETLSSLEDQK